MHHLVDIIVAFADKLGYTGIFIMMVIESSFIPFPSEVAMIPAGYLSSIGKMNIVFAFMAGTIWAMVWASINYFLWKHLGATVIKKLIEKYGKYILFNAHHYEKSEKYFKSHWAITTLLGRFIPGVRQLISIPAGIFRMNYGVFLIYTFIWAGSWNAILLAIGYIAWENEELIHKMTGNAVLIIFLILWTIVWGYVLYAKKQVKLTK